MRLIVDTNVILSALLKKGLNRKLITTDIIEFYTVDYVLDEIEEYKEYILKKSHLSEDKFEILLGFFMENIMIIDDKKIKGKIKEAKNIMKDIDIKDAPILACALAIQNDGIWTTDKHFDKQNKVRVWSSKDLLRIAEDF